MRHTNAIHSQKIFTFSLKSERHWQAFILCLDIFHELQTPLSSQIRSNHSCVYESHLAVEEAKYTYGCINKISPVIYTTCSDLFQMLVYLWVVLFWFFFWGGEWFMCLLIFIAKFQMIFDTS